MKEIKKTNFKNSSKKLNKKVKINKIKSKDLDLKQHLQNIILYSTEFSSLNEDSNLLEKTEIQKKINNMHLLIEKHPLFKDVSGSYEVLQNIQDFIEDDGNNYLELKESIEFSLDQIRKYNKKETLNSEHGGEIEILDLETYGIDDDYRYNFSESLRYSDNEEYSEEDAFSFMGEEFKDWGSDNDIEGNRI